MYLMGTNVISELRKKSRVNPDVLTFSEDINTNNRTLSLSAVTAGELRRGGVLIRDRGDTQQA